MLSGSVQARAEDHVAMETQEDVERGPSDEKVSRGNNATNKHKNGERKQPSSPAQPGCVRTGCATPTALN
jgi:hypothetical protein